MLNVLFTVLAVLATATYTAALPSSQWKENLIERLEEKRVVSFNLALHPRDAHAVEDTLLRIATPKSTTFRKYLKQEEVLQLVGRSDLEIQRIVDWLQPEGANLKVHPEKDSVRVQGLTVDQIESLFSCKLALFKHAVTGESTIVAMDGKYTIPNHLRDLVQLIPGLTTFPATRLEAKKITAGADAAAVPAEVTPETIYTNYQSPNGGSRDSKNKLGTQCVVEFGRLANFNEADSQQFFKELAPALEGETCGSIECELCAPNNGDAKPSVEANLDVQYIQAAGTFINTTDYKLSSSQDIEDEFLAYTTMVNAEYLPPLVHSISYGEYGGDYDNATDQRFSYELQKMGLKGISVLLASGDNGVGCDKLGTTQEFDYPSSPYITMVGATYIDKSTNEEVGATLSSGGFSKDFYRASWQNDAVEAYLKSGVKMPSEDFYSEGRAYPDIAAYGQNVQVVSSGKASGVSGTSCSAPIFAGLVAQINHELMSAGEAPLGFLNPWLYANPGMFTDIVSGSNPYEKCDGFQAAPGWDPVTGLGTPIYPLMKKAAFAALK